MEGEKRRGERTSDHYYTTKELGSIRSKIVQSPDLFSTSFVNALALGSAGATDGSLPLSRRRRHRRRRRSLRNILVAARVPWRDWGPTSINAEESNQTQKEKERERRKSSLAPRSHSAASAGRRCLSARHDEEDEVAATTTNSTQSALTLPSSFFFFFFGGGGGPPSFATHNHSLSFPNFIAHPSKQWTIGPNRSCPRLLLLAPHTD